MCLSANTLRQKHRHCVHRFHGLGCLRQQANRTEPGVCGICEACKNDDALVLGFKLHLVINECGELLGVTFTPGNVEDRVPVPSLTRRIAGKLFGDKGYISAALFRSLWERGIQLITSIRKNMKNTLMPLMDKILLRKRSLIETVNDQLRNIAQIEHTRHRSVCNFMVNLVAGLIGYTHQPKKNRFANPAQGTPNAHRHRLYKTQVITLFFGRLLFYNALPLRGNYIP
jgi:hypothetical protein